MSHDYAYRVTKMPDPYVEGRRVRRQKIFERAAEIRYTAVKYKHQRAWADLTDRDRQLWIEVQTESHKALLESLADARWTLLEFVLDSDA